MRGAVCATLSCHVSCVLPLGCSIWPGCDMARRKETTIERIYREVNGNNMPAAVKRVLLPKRTPRGSGWSRTWGEAIILSDAWTKTLADGRRVKFTNQELQDDWVFITAQVERNKIVYSIVFTDAKDSLSREEVESQFEGELSNKPLKPN